MALANRPRVPIRLNLPPADEVPFSLQNALVAGGHRWAERAPRSAHVQMPTGDDCEPLVSTRKERENECGRMQWLLPVIVSSSMLVVIVLLCIMFARMTDVLEDIDSTTLAQRVDLALSHATNAASNTERTTANMLTMSDALRDGLLSAIPRMSDAFNESTAAVHSVASFAAHPTLTIGAG